MNVQIAQLVVTDDPTEVLCATGLGSCVALMLGGRARDERVVFGLAHVLLPDSSGDTRSRPGEPSKFADTAVPALVEATLLAGARRATLQAALVGGASMFRFGNASARDIGERNASALQHALGRSGVRLVANDVGGSRGRSVRMVVAEGRVLVRRSGSSERELLHIDGKAATTEEGRAHGTSADRR